MKRAMLILIGLTVFFSLLAAEVKIGVVNAQVILQNIEKGKEAAKRLEDFVKQRQSKVQTMQAEIEKLSKELANPALNADSQQKKGLELENKKTQLQRYGEDAQREIMVQRQKELEPIQKDLLDIIHNIAKTENFSLILDVSADPNTPSNIVYFSDSIDLSIRVAKAYNEKFPVTANK